MCVYVVYVYVVCGVLCVCRPEVDVKNLFIALPFYLRQSLSVKPRSYIYNYSC